MPAPPTVTPTSTASAAPDARELADKTPVELAFVAPITAENDWVFSTERAQIVEVMSNDLAGPRAIIATVGSVRGLDISIAEDGRSLIIIGGADFAEPTTFSYTISDGSRDASATVTVRPVEGLTVLDSSGGAPAQFLGDESTGQSDGANPAGGLLGSLRSVEIPTPLAALADLRLPLLPMTSVVAAIVPFLLWFRVAIRRKRYLNVLNVPRDEQLHADPGAVPFALRHNVERIWTTGRRRTAQGLIQAETPNGLAWIPTDRIEDR